MEYLSTQEQDIIINNNGINQLTFDKWLSQVDATSNTIETYKKQITQFISYLSYESKTNPTRDDVINFRDYLAHKNNDSHLRYDTKTHEYVSVSEPLKISTINGYLMAIKQFFNYCSENGIYDNIAKHVKPLKQAREHKKDSISLSLTSEILKSIDMDSKNGLRDYAIIYLARTSGLRVNEISTLRIKDIKQIDDTTVLNVLRKGYSERQKKAISTDTANVIRAYLKTRTITSENEPLFISVSNRNANKEPMTNRSLSRIVKEHLRELGITDNAKSFHSLRHGYATDLLRNGVNIIDVSKELNHKNISTTQLYIDDIKSTNSEYSSIIASKLNDALNK